MPSSVMAVEPEKSKVADEGVNSIILYSRVLIRRDATPNITKIRRVVAVRFWPRLCKKANTVLKCASLRKICQSSFSQQI